MPQDTHTKANVEQPKQAAPRSVAVANTAPRTYAGPVPAPHIGNLPCGCTIQADKLDREQQDFVIATVPEAANWYVE